jgi:flagellin
MSQGSEAMAVQGLSLLTNRGATTSNRALTRISRDLHDSVSRLSSGLRVQSASEDSAALSQTENLRAQRLGAQQAMRNANDGLNILNTAEATYQSVSDTLSRMRELAVQAASDGLTDQERGLLEVEFLALQNEIDRMATVAEYNGIQLADGSVSDLTFHVGYRNTAFDGITADLDDIRSDALGVGAGVGVGNQSGAQSAIDSVDAALETLSESRAGLGGSINRLSQAVSTLMSADTNFAEAIGNGRDADVGAESADFARDQVRQQAGVAMLAQSNTLAQVALRLLG